MTSHDDGRRATQLSGGIVCASLLVALVCGSLVPLLVSGIAAWMTLHSGLALSRESRPR